jgi:hypothetical protein
LLEIAATGGKMKIKQFIREFIVFFCITFVASMAVSYFYNFFVHGSGALEWATAFRTALLFATVFPLIDLAGARKKKK